MGDTVTIVSPEGRASDVDPATVAAYTSRGWHVQGDTEHAEGVGNEARAAQTNVVDALGQGILRGATFGASDVAQTALGGENAQIYLQQLRQAHQTASTAGSIIGAVLPAIATGGASAPESGAAELGTLAGAATDIGGGASELGGVQSLAAATPAGMVSKLGSSIAGLGEGGSAIGRAGYTAAGGALEGAAQNAGGYVSDVALGDRKLSADGFVGAMGNGALWGGVAGGALSLSSEGLTAARRLLPGTEFSAAGAKAARSAASDAIGSAVDDSTTLGQVAESKLNELSAQEQVTNPGFKQRLQEIKLKAAQDVADAQVAKARGFSTNPNIDKSLLDGVAADAPVPARALSADKAKSVFGDILGDAPEASSGADDLISKLQGTKARLDTGEPLAGISSRSTQDAINAELGKVNPEAAKINDALTRTRASSQKLNEWLDKYGSDSSVAYDAASPAARKAKIADWAKGAEPADVEGQKAADHFLNQPENTGTRLGAQAPADVQKAANAAGADAAHAAYLETVPEAANVAKSGTELMARSRYAGARAAAKAQDEVHTAWAAGRSPTGEEILGAEPVGAKVDKALKAHSGDFADDVNETAKTLNEHEAAHADLAEALGPSAPPASQAKASDFRAAQKAAEDKTAAQVSIASDAIGKMPSSVGSKLLDGASNAAQTYEALRMMGVPLPDPKGIPVVGPLLSMYLKAKLVGKALGGRGGGIMSTAETTIASKSAAIRQRIYSAADTMLAGGSKAAAAAAPVSGGVAAILGHKLFDAGPPAKAPYSSAPEDGSVGDLYLKRSNEVIAATKPGAIQDAITQRVRTSDPEALAEIIATKTREINYIASKMPQPASPPGALEDRVWLPAKADLAAWSRVIAATQNPADVLERAAVGKAGSDELEAVKNVYPSLYADAQKHVLDQVTNGKGQGLTTVQRSQVAQTWGLPLTTASQPGHATWLQAGYTATPPAPQPVGPAMQPTIHAPVNIGQRTLTHLDQP